MKLHETLIEILMDRLRSATIKVEFTKKDGTLREMLCTLNPALIPDEHTPKGNAVVEDEEEPTYVRVFDVEKQGWRSIIFDNIVDFRASA